MRGRFAPSPSGALHLGNARTALLAWASARAQGGAFVLRVEDLDPPRTVAAAVSGNLEELRWLGLDWDEGPDVGGAHEPYRQSERQAAYDAAFERLAARGLLAEDWLSRKDLREVASAPHGPVGPVYAARERARSERLAAARRAEGASPSWRVRFAEPYVDVHDARLGARRFDLAAETGDLLVRRRDGIWAYALAVVVDDAAMGITEVVRGDDLWDATGVQAALARALDLPVPRYAHVPLLLDGDGVRLAKRRGAATLAAYREAGVDPHRLVGALAATAGLVPAPTSLAPAELLPAFGLARLDAAPARWSPALEAWVRAR
ncbi:MAG: tRNA glutamyl-Q(34) synthetase GluQRS [Trueperaceae bacterium]|nr:tRNA glutamyl-Q(34) synthetase GluQRS [Trueperaceae bacterium]